MIELNFKQGQVFLAMDESLGGFPTPWAALNAAQLLAMDDGENRTFDRDGRMHVKTSNISKANVCDYLGREIPKGGELGLDPNKKYKLLRDPEELAKGASTFNNLPILAAHVPVTAMDHQPHLIIGTTGTDASYEHPYLKNSTAFWAGGAIHAIDSEAMRDLSSAYHFRADMTPGEYEGEAYDGVMRDIVGNHVALVRKGRAGDDVVVGDSKPEELYMTKAVLSRTALFAAGATSVLLASKMAMDAAPIDTSEIFKDVTAKNFAAKKPDILARTKLALKDVKLAQDASLDGILGLIDKLEQPEVMEGADADPATGAPMDEAALKEALVDPGAADADAETKRREFLAGKLTPQDLQAYDALCGKTGMDADPTNIETPAVKEDDMKIDKPAMDAAINTAVQAERTRATAIRAAELAVAPYVGQLSMAFDSAPAVYTKALEMMGVKVPTGTHPDALPSILAVQPKPGARPAPVNIAMDAAPSTDFHARYPNAARIGAA